MTQTVRTYLGPGGADAISPSAYFSLPPYAYDSLAAIGAAAKAVDVIRLTRSAMPYYRQWWTQHNAIANQYHVQLDTGMTNRYNEEFTFLRDSTSATLFNQFCLATPRVGNLNGAFGVLESVYDTTSVKYRALMANTFQCESATDTIPGITMLRTPLDSVYILYSRDSFLWFVAARATSSRLQAAYDTAFTQMILDTVVADSILPQLDWQVNRNIYWRVCGVNAKGQ